MNVKHTHVNTCEIIYVIAYIKAIEMISKNSIFPFILNSIYVYFKVIFEFYYEYEKKNVQIFSVKFKFIMIKNKIYYIVLIHLYDNNIIYS